MICSMKENKIKQRQFTLGKTSGASPAEDKYDILVIFDISSDKKRRKLIKIVESYGGRIQESCFMMFLNNTLHNKLLKKLFKLMDRDKNINDDIRVFKFSNPAIVNIIADENADLGFNKTDISEDIFL